MQLFAGWWYGAGVHRDPPALGTRPEEADPLDRGGLRRSGGIVHRSITRMESAEREGAARRAHSIVRCYCRRVYQYFQPYQMYDKIHDRWIPL